MHWTPLSAWLPIAVSRAWGQKRDLIRPPPTAARYAGTSADGRHISRMETTASTAAETGGSRRVISSRAETTPAVGNGKDLVNTHHDTSQRIGGTISNSVRHIRKVLAATKLGWHTSICFRASGARYVVPPAAGMALCVALKDGVHRGKWPPHVLFPRLPHTKGDSTSEVTLPSARVRSSGMG